MTTNEKTINVENRGAISSLEIKVAPGRIAVARGHNGSGKSTALEQVQAAVTGGRPPGSNHDGTNKGVVEGLGIKMTVGKNARRTGEIEIDSFDEKFTIKDIIRPPFKQLDSQDMHTIRAILYLNQQEPEADMFRTILPAEEFDRIVPPEALQKTDTPAMP